MKYFYLFLLTAIVNISIDTFVHAQILNADKFGRSTDTTKTMTGFLELAFNLNKQKELIYAASTNTEVPIEKLYYSIQNKFRIDFRI